MKSVILTGGLGTRLNTMFPDTPKSLVYIGNKPVIEHQIIQLNKIGGIHIITNTDFQSKFIHYIHDACLIFEKDRFGTATGLYQAKKEIKEDFILSYGDIIYDLDWNKIIDFHNQHNKICTLILHPTDHVFDSDLVEIDKENNVTALHKKPHKFAANLRNLGVTGLFIFSPKIFNYIEPYSEEKQDIVQDIIPKLIKDQQISGYKTTEYIKDMGTPDRLLQVRTDFQNGTIKDRNYSKKRPAIFLDRDGNINKNKGLISSMKDFELMPFVAEAIKIINQNNYYAIVITNQSVIARNLCSEETLNKIHNKMEWELGRYGSFLDAIYYCPHHPDGGYPEERKEYKIDCSCRKPKIGMIEQACRDFNIDLTESWIVGDSDIDMLTGKNAGIKCLKNTDGNLLFNIQLALGLVKDERIDSVLNNIGVKYDNY